MARLSTKWGMEELEQLARNLAPGFSPRHLASDIDENLALLFLQLFSSRQNIQILPCPTDIFRCRI
jgi:hypothetical protein